MRKPLLERRHDFRIAALEINHEVTVSLLPGVTNTIIVFQPVFPVSKDAPRADTVRSNCRP